MDFKTIIANKPTHETISFLPLGGIEDVTKNMYLYQYRDEILIVDCGIGFADETMLGVDLLLPDISYLLSTKKRIVGMVLTHGHEDHIGALPFILPQLPKFPVYGTPLTAMLANEKLKEFEHPHRVQVVEFNKPDVRMGSFGARFIKITHSVPDSSSIFIKTPVGNFVHTGDFKLDLTPADGKRSDYQRLADAGREGVMALMSDSLGSERPGFTPTEKGMDQSFEREMRMCEGKFIVTTYSSNIARLNQAIQAAERVGRKVCFVGRSLIKVKDVGIKMGYLLMKQGTEVEIENLCHMADNEVMLVVAGSQGQENSALTRIANDEHKDISLSPKDTVVFSSDPIPGNEISVTELIDVIFKKGVKALYSTLTGHMFHVSGHGSAGDLQLMMSLIRPQYLVPVSGNYKHMVAYKKLGLEMGYEEKEIFLQENGQELIFSKNGVKLGQKIELKSVYVDQISGEEVDSYVLRDREKLAKEGIVIIMTEINASSGQLTDNPALITRGFNPADEKALLGTLPADIRKQLGGKKAQVKNWSHMRKVVSDIAGKHIFKTLRRRPLILPVIIEV
jgi:ribonuclease J